MSGRDVAIDWRGRRTTAHVPDPLAQRSAPLDVGTARALERAAGSLVRADEHLPIHFEPLFRLLLRAEGIASSNIEGLQASLPEVAAAELAPVSGEVASAVADNLHAVVAAVLDARHTGLDQASLNRWHGTLMRDAAHLEPYQRGAMRTEQSWIGGLSPLDAAFVPPPPDLVPDLMRDLVTFANRTDLDPIAQAAMVHVQFESIHPYADGNGRIGRLLIGWILTRRLELHSPPPVSVRISADRGGYLATMTMWRLGTSTPWIGWFADVVDSAARSAYVLVDRIADLQQAWRERLTGVRSDGSAWALLELLPARPALTAGLAAEQLGIGVPSARKALAALEARGIVKPFTPSAPGRPGRPDSWWVASEIADLIGSWARS